MKIKKIILLIISLIIAIGLIIFSAQSLNHREVSRLNNNITFFQTDFFNKKKNSLAENHEAQNNPEILEIEIDKSLRFLFFGDLMLDRHVAEKINLYGLSHLLEKLNTEEFTKNYDFVMANLEGATTNDGQHYPPVNLYDFAFKPEVVVELKNYNFNIFTLSNNHLADQGQQGIDETYLNLSELGFNYVGCQDGVLSTEDDYQKIFKANENEKQQILTTDNCSTIIIEEKSKKISFLSFSIVYRDIEEKLILEKIKQLKLHSDFLIISPHWGVEYQEQANQKQRSLAKKMIEAGADLIVGHHPHVIQDWEIYQEKPIFYSLGNFIFDQYFSPETQESLAIKVDLDESNQITTTIYKLKTKGSRVEEILEIN